MPILHKTRGACKCTTTPETLGIGKVLDVRLWPDSNLIEIDLHLPAVNMLDWKEIMEITFAISRVCSGKIIPFGWDAETGTCSLIVDFEGLAWFRTSHTAKLFQEYFNTRTIPVTNQKDLLPWLVSQQYCASHTSFYLAGNSGFNNNISRSLKAMNHQNIPVVLPFSDSTPTILKYIELQ